MRTPPLFPLASARRIEDVGVIAVLVVDRTEDGVPLAEALLAGGVSTMELTLRTPVAIDVLKLVRARVPEMFAGVGTVLSPDQLKEARDAGAAFGVSPGINARVLKTAGEEKFPFAPGIMTPSDIEVALEHGCNLLKFFPAEQCGGLSYLKTIAAPYAFRNLRFVPLGGLNPGNIKAYMADPLIAALGGSWLAPRDAIVARDWKRITALASEARQMIEDVRKGSA